MYTTFAHCSSCPHSCCIFLVSLGRHVCEAQHDCQWERDPLFRHCFVSILISKGAHMATYPGATPTSSPHLAHSSFAWLVSTKTRITLPLFVLLVLVVSSALSVRRSTPCPCAASRRLVLRSGGTTRPRNSSVWVPGVAWLFTLQPARGHGSRWASSAPAPDQQGTAPTD